METLTGHPENKKQSVALKAFMKAFNISFEENKSAYDPDFGAKIQESTKQAESGETKIMNVEDL